jgi:murein DD-endopeptidase MepM/ murein hydrolase activator NlpD
MYNLNQYRFNKVNKSHNTKLKKTAYQLGIVLIMLLVLMLIKYTKNQIGTNLNEKIQNVFYADFTEKAQSVFNNTYPLINNYINKSTNNGDTLSETNEDFVIDYLPVNGEITSEFGTRIHPVTNKSETHTGVDIAVAEGTEVKAIYDGTVEDVTDDETLGIVIVINHNNGFKSKYGHLSEVKVNKGDEITKGSIIALSGSTGVSTGPHLHFEVSFNDESVDPTSLLKTIAN